MAVQRLEHVGIVVEDLEAATEFFTLLGLERRGGTSVEGSWVDRIVGLESVRSEIVMLRAPDGGEVELAKFHSPPSEPADPRAPSNAPGLRHITFLVEGIESLVAELQERGFGLVGELERYENAYLLCYVRGPEGIIVELAERIG
ncbi:MAG TPA: VOC family protein [Solirubrobacterales bacterium]|nr:VOC family protein [Solirubrobacterales bacterium]